jgi:hypothetical protein
VLSPWKCFVLFRYAALISFGICALSDPGKGMHAGDRKNAQQSNNLAGEAPSFLSVCSFDFELQEMPIKPATILLGKTFDCYLLQSKQEKNLGKRR